MKDYKEYQERTTKYDLAMAKAAACENKVEGELIKQLADLEQGAYYDRKDYSKALTDVAQAIADEARYIYIKERMNQAEAKRIALDNTLAKIDMLTFIQERAEEADELLKEMEKGQET